MIFIASCIIPTSFSNLSNLVSLSLSNMTFQGFKNSLFIFRQSSFWSLKIEGEFRSCFQNMTRLKRLDLISIRESRPTPFPTQFCNMIFLQKFTTRNSNFSGFWKKRFYLKGLFILLGPIPIELTRLVGLRVLNFGLENLLTGFHWKKNWFHFHLLDFEN